MRHQWFQWYRPNAKGRANGRRCRTCGLRRRIKPGTRTVWQSRYLHNETWLDGLWPCKQRRSY